MTAAATDTLLYDPTAAAPPPSDVGGKTRGLLAIAAAGLPTAPWFVLRAEAQRRCPDAAPDSELACEVERACRDLLASAGATALAVRSSALDEDGATASFAGQYQTILNVGPDAVMAAIASCWTTTPAGTVYRSARGSSGPTEGAVIVQALVPAAVSGVAFSRAPDTDADEIVVVATRGLGPLLVGGQVDGDEYRALADGRVEVRRIDQEPWRLSAGPEGELVRTRVTAPEAGRRCMEDDQVRAVADAARRLEAWCGGPQDVEWALTSEGTLLVLQTRPITALNTKLRTQNSELETRVWDNANIVESFPGVTTPLTFSVAREAYAAVYRQACRAVGVSARTVAENEGLFEQMIGLIEGRVYYNLISWHRVLALLPGFRLNQGFMERMMGALRPGARPGESAPGQPAACPRFAESALVVLRLAWRLATLDRDVRRFLRSIEQVRADMSARELEGLTPDRLLDDYDELRRRALGSWRAPIMNDLFLMVFHGLFRKAADRWLGANADALANGMLRGAAVPSAALAEELMAIAERVRLEPSWLAALQESAEPAGSDRIKDHPQLADLRDMIDAYLARWGDRCPEELKLDRPTYREDPTPLYRSLLALAAAEPDTHRYARPQPDLWGEIERRLAEAGPLRGRVRSALFGLLANRARHHLRAREEMRFARGQVFGIGRRIFNAMGAGFARCGLLDRPEDIHYLDLNEIRGAIRGTAEHGDLRTMVAERRARYQQYRASGGPPNRFETRGPVGLAIRRPGELSQPSLQQGGVLQGVAAAPGRVRAPCVVVDDPRAVDAVGGCIVVARSTDPGWVPIFVSAAGLVVERGSLLSHSAILARELGLPTVVGIPNLMSSVATGQVLEVDGSTGQVRVLPDTREDTTAPTREPQGAAQR